GDAHVMIVDDDGEHVGRGTVRAQQYEVVEILVLPHDAALDRVVDHGFALERRLEADGRLGAGRRLAWITVAPAAIIKTGAPFASGRVAHGLELFGGRVTVIRAAGGQQLLGRGPIMIAARRLIDRIAVPREAEPVETVGNGVEVRL